MTTVQPSILEVRGGLTASNQSTNVGWALTYPPGSFPFYFDNFVRLSGLVAYLPSSTLTDGTGNLQLLDAVVQADGSTALKVSVQGAAITMAATAAAMKVAVGAADTQVKAATPTRRYMVIVNTSSTQSITITFGAGAAVLGQGITLLPGQAYEMSMGAGNLSTQEVRAIASAAGGQLSIQEGT